MSGPGTTPPNPPPRRLILAGSDTRPRALLLIEPRDGSVRGSFWRLREHRDLHIPKPPQALVDKLHQAGILPAGGNRARGAWIRVAATALTVELLCEELLADDPRHEWRTVAAYLRACPWADELP